MQETSREAGGESGSERDLARLGRLVVGAALELTGARACAFWLLASEGLALRRLALGGVVTEGEYPDAIREEMVRLVRTEGRAVFLMSELTAPATGLVEEPQLHPVEPGHRGADVLVPIAHGGNVLALLDIRGLAPAEAWGQSLVRLQSLLAVSAEALRNVLLFQGSLAAAQEARSKTADLERKGRDTEALVYAMCHDLKTPLVSLQGLLDRLESEYGQGSNDQGHQYLARLRANATRMEALVKDLLEFTRLGHILPHKEKVDSGQVLRAVREGLALQLTEREATLVLQGPFPVVWADYGQLFQLFTNLLDNAIKHVPEGQRPSIEVSCHDSDSQRVFAVQDNAPAIPPEYQEQVFAPFVRGPEAPGVEPAGTGVGLAIVKRIAEAHGGSVTLESVRGKGNTFRVFLPKGNSGSD